MGQKLKTEKMKKSVLDHNALIFKKPQIFCDDKFFYIFLEKGFREKICHLYRVTFNDAKLAKSRRKNFMFVV